MIVIIVIDVDSCTVLMSPLRKLFGHPSLDTSSTIGIPSNAGNFSLVAIPELPLTTYCLPVLSIAIRTPLSSLELCLLAACVYGTAKLSAYHFYLK